MPKNIVVLGAGFGGLRAVFRICKELKKLKLADKYKVILVDRYSHHTFTPLLYEVATTSQSIADYLELKYLVTYPLSRIFEGKKVQIIKDEVLDVDLEDGEVHLKNGDINFDYLILALGAETNYFDIPGLEGKALPFKTFDNAIAVRDALFSRAMRKESLRIIIGGGGSTGVELAAELTKWINSELCKVPPIKCDLSLSIIEGANTILPGFDEKIIRIVTNRLNRLGVNLITGETIERISDNELFLKSGKSVPFDVLIWTGGVRASSVTRKMSLKRGERGRVEVLGEMGCVPQTPELKVYPVGNKPPLTAAAAPSARGVSDRIYGRGVYAIGDIACFYDPKTGRPTPLVARAAIVQGDIAAKNIIGEIKKDINSKHKVATYTYKWRRYPYIIPVGGKFAVAKLGPFIISGFLGWILKGLVELNYLLSILPPVEALKIWLRGLWVFIQNDRLG